jgi:hypothetical protein
VHGKHLANENGEGNFPAVFKATGHGAWENITGWAAYAITSHFHF